MLVRRWFFTVVVMVALLSAGSVPAEVPVPIKDLYTLTDGGSVWLGAALGGYLYYGGCYQEDFYGCELVRTPIGGSGVERVKDIQPGPDGSNPDHFMTVGGLVFFRANGNQLWKTDGTEAGTQRVRSFSSLSDPRQDAFRWAAVGNTLFFRAQDNFGMELWMTDGTTSSRIDLCGGSCDGDPRWLTTLGSSVIFSGSNGSDVELWRHQGGITTRYADINPSGSSFPDHIESLGGVAVFQAQDATEQGLFSTDGATVSKIAGSATFFYGFTDLKVAGGIAFFDGNDGGVLSGRELWISNGTQAGTALIKDIRPGSFSSDPQDFAAVGNLMYFTANDGTNGRELWVSNGNGAGTLPLEIVPGSGSPSFQYDIVDLNGGQAFFVADNGSGTGSEPWVSNGTPAGTILLGDFVPGSSGLVSGQPMTTSGFAFFHGSASGSELWRSNGTTAGTVPLTQLSTNSGGGAPNQIVSYGGYGYFCTDDGIHGKELWRTDGTTAGTFLLQDLNPGYRSGCDGNIVSSGGSLYIPGINGTDFGLWRSNGQPGGTVWVKTFNAAPQQLVAYNGIVCFVADDGGGAGAELWCSNGTTGGTYLVKDVYPGSLPATITDLTAVGGQLYFGGRFNSTGDFELWKSNGTEMGTVVVRDIQPGSAGSFPGNFGAVGSTVLFTAYTSADGDRTLEDRRHRRWHRHGQGHQYLGIRSQRCRRVLPARRLRLLRRRRRQLRPRAVADRWDHRQHDPGCGHPSREQRQLPAELRADQRHPSAVFRRRRQCRSRALDHRRQFHDPAPGHQPVRFVRSREFLRHRCRQPDLLPRGRGQLRGRPLDQRPDPRRDHGLVFAPSRGRQPEQLRLRRLEDRVHRIHRRHRQRALELRPGRLRRRSGGGLSRLCSPTAAPATAPTRWWDPGSGRSSMPTTTDSPRPRPTVTTSTVPMTKTAWSSPRPSNPTSWRPLT
jgi:ELWxxDGT repeat protein